MTVQDIQITVPVPSLAQDGRRKPWWQQLAEKNEQQAAIRMGLDLGAKRPSLPITVKLVRVSSGRLEKHDNLRASLKHVADTFARWAHGLPESIPLVKAGVVQFKRGKLVMTKPPAPDGDDCGIEWEYDQQKCRRGGAPGVRIIITEDDRPNDPATPRQEPPPRQAQAVAAGAHQSHGGAGAREGAQPQQGAEGD